MPRKRAEDFVSHLNFDERAEVLGEVLKRHPELREEANATAQGPIDAETQGTLQGLRSQPNGNAGLLILEPKDGTPASCMEQAVIKVAVKFMNVRRK